MSQFGRICLDVFLLYWVMDETGPITLLTLVLLMLTVEWFSYKQQLMDTVMRENGLSIDQSLLSKHLAKLRGD